MPEQTVETPILDLLASMTATRSRPRPRFGDADPGQSPRWSQSMHRRFRMPSISRLLVTWRSIRSGFGVSSRRSRRSSAPPVSLRRQQDRAGARDRARDRRARGGDRGRGLSRLGRLPPGRRETTSSDRGPEGTRVVARAHPGVSSLDAIGSWIDARAKPRWRALVDGVAARAQHRPPPACKSPLRDLHRHRFFVSIGAVLHVTAGSSVRVVKMSLRLRGAPPG